MSMRHPAAGTRTKPGGETADATTVTAGTQALDAPVGGARGGLLARRHDRGALPAAGGVAVMWPSTGVALAALVAWGPRVAAGLVAGCIAIGYRSGRRRRGVLLGSADHA
jgi:hypothetical protein